MNIEKILLIIIIIYLIFLHCKKIKNIENFAVTDDIRSLIKEIYNTDMDAVRQLSDMADKLNTSGLTIPGDLTVTGTITGKKTIDGSINGNAATATSATSATSAGSAGSAGSASSVTSATSAEYVTSGIKNGASYVLYNNSGRIGIGKEDSTSSKTLVYPLEVWGYNNPNFDGRLADGYTFRYSSSYPFKISIRAEYGIRINADIVWNSDKRIKKNIKDMEGNSALSQIRLIQPKIYNYIDYNTKGDNNVYGFIAQEVKDVILHSTMLSKDYISNFYCKGVIHDINNNIYEISSDNDLCFENVIDNDGNEIIHHKIKFYGYDNTEYICSVIQINNSKNIHVKLEKEYIFSNDKENKNKIFIYGQEIYDFHSLDKNAVWTIATAALKEVDKKQQEDEISITELESIVASQEKKIANQEIIINNILERLNKL
jgi:hypothetical protein